uniref:DNA polymerase I n=1 Tax=Candidatus Kentrum eta TaxID=2126337 RepID=A0A450V052_9GAMM|nr:MAG: DNA polymerase I [Candidatus Kentron sp. H]VFJ98367.1 MAG: DNA polymerase I [Candidatus Kentron sp. H]VFK03479.1 MAG: DNA polymerase I [Candidatus Kentron sp. H]
MKDKPLLVLVDGSSYLYRAFHAMPALTSSRGQPTGAVYGVVNMLRRLLAEAPDYMAVVFDAKGKTFREGLYADYKANRAAMPEALQRQIEPLHELIMALGLPILAVPGVEADDVIGTLATQAGAAGLSVRISTGDKDFAQLVTDDVILVNTMDDSRLDPAGVEDKFGVPPGLIVDYLALMGDASDNVPGVPKVGPKTARNWLGSHGSLDAVIANADRIKGKVGENLRASLAQLSVSRALVTIRCDISLDRGPRDLVRTEPDTARLKALYTELEFKSWLSELLAAAGEGGSPPGSPSADGDAPPAPGAEIILDRAGFETWLERLGKATLFAFDTETTGLDCLTAEIVGVSFAVKNDEPGEPNPIRAAYVPVGHDYPGAPDQLSRKSVLAALKPLLEDSARAKVGQNLKYDRQILDRYGIRIAGPVFDTMLESYVLDSVAARHDMDTLALKYLGRKTIPFEAVAGKGAKQITFDQVPLEQAGPYAAEDAQVTLALHETLWPRVCETPELKSVFEDIEMPLMPVLAEMEREGVRIDGALLAQQSAALARGIAEIEREAHDIAGEPFNLASPKQIQAILFERQGLPVKAKTPKGQPSTAESVLQELADDYPLPRLILEYRALGKLKSTYTDALPTRIHPVSGRVHTHYHQAVTATGRLSSSEPNLQNIPIRTQEGRRIRQAFIAPPGFRLLAADYSQIELRIMAHLSGDEGLKKAFSSGVDIHAATAAELFGDSETGEGTTESGAEGVTPGFTPGVTKEQRRRAKAINFGLIYGMSAFGLARQLGIERWRAQAYMDRYFQRYPDVKAFMESVHARAREEGFVETLFGRRLYLPDINAPNAQRRQYAERAAVNAPMQGTAADIIKRAMIGLHGWLAAERPAVRMIMQVHDELVFEVAEEALDKAAAVIGEQMTGAAALSVPLVVAIGVGANWDEAH